VKGNPQNQYSGRMRDPKFILKVNIHFLGRGF